jgi:hypothetical protein
LISIQAADLPIYTDALESGWEDWSWGSVASSSSVVHGGQHSLAVMVDAWEADYFHNGALDATLYTNLTFWINPGQGKGELQVQALSSGNPQTAVNLPALAANSWQQISISLQQLGVATDPAFDGFWIQDRTGKTQPTFYLDDMKLVAGATPVQTNSALVSIQIDAAANRHPISDYIYGVAFASASQLQALNSPLNRSGGNAESRYNWQLNAHNHAFDWYFESLADSSATPGAETDNFIADTEAAHADAMVTIPMIGWAAKLGPNRQRLSSFSIAKYGAQTGSDAQWFPDAGNGISAATGQPITSNDPTDANIPIDSTFEQDWVRHLTNRWGSSQNGGVRFYMMDNEPSIWHSTHRDVVKTGLRMTELRDRVIDYAQKAREVDSAALIAGPEEWGWSGYIYSGYDQQWGAAHGWSNLPDRKANGGMDYLPWFLKSMHDYEQSNGKRLLDIFTVHYYPQGGEYGNDVSSAMQTRRNRSTRSLWDPNYTDQSWINDKVRLIPRLKEWVQQYYPGTKIGLTEYSWGADNHINGATAQADILGILGREGIDYATRWVVPDTGTPTFKAMQMFRNYDGANSHFGETSISAAVPNPDNLSAFASIRSSDGALTVMAINKTQTASPISLSITNATVAKSVTAWQLTSANTITRLPDAIITGSALTNLLPAQSITLFVFEPGETAAHFLNLRLNGSSLASDLAGAAGETYQIESTADLKSWTPIQTITVNSSPAAVTLPLTETARFFRAIRARP